MKFTNDRPFADPDKAARRQKQHAHAFEPVQDGRIYIEKLNGPFLFGDKGTPAEYAAGLDRAISLGWLEIHEPALRFFMARPTFFEAPLEYFLFFAFLAIALVLRCFWSIRIGPQRSAKGSFSLVKCRETRGVGMTFEIKVAFAVLRLM